MNKYNDDYYIMFMPHGDEQIYVKPNVQTAKRKSHYEKLTIGGAPLFFENSYREEDKNQWPITDVLVDTSGFLAPQRSYDMIKRLEIQYLQLAPAVYVDDDDKYHEHFWYFGFYNEINCLDIVNSTIESVDYDDEDDEQRLEVFKYSLNEESLDLIEEEKRLMFKIGGCSKKYIFVHKKIVEMFKNDSGIRFIKVAHFEEGLQHRA